MGVDRFYRHLPLIDIDIQAIGREVTWYRDWCAHTVYDEYWKALNTEAKLDAVNVPVVKQAAWYDPYSASMLRTWRTLHERRNDQKIYVIPWTHHLPESSRRRHRDHVRRGHRRRDCARRPVHPRGARLPVWVDGWW